MLLAKHKPAQVKTMAFLTATFHHLLTHQPNFASNQPRALILAPTRELAVQINHDAELLAKSKWVTNRTCLWWGWL